MIKNIIYFCLVLACPLNIAIGDTIKEIRVIDLNNNVINSGQILSYSQVSVGDKIIDKDLLVSTISDDTDLIINSGKFSFVKSNLIEEMDGFIIVYQIKPKFRLRQIEIIGSDKISNKKIKEKSELILGSLVDDVDFENAVKKIKNAYKEYWYPYAEASWKSKSNKMNNHMIISFKYVPAAQKVFIS